MSKKHLQRILLTTIKWSLTIFLLCYALQDIELSALLSIVQKQHPLVPIAVIALFVVQMSISTWRWERILKLLAHTTIPSWKRLFSLNYISVFFNNCLPGTIGGDVIRIFMLRKSLPLEICAHSVILDRLIAIAAICVMVLVGLPWLVTLLPALPYGEILLVTGILIAAGLLTLILAPAYLAKYTHRSSIKHLLALLHNLRLLLFSPLPLLITLFQAILAHGCFCISAFLLAQSLDAPLTLLQSFVLIPPVILLMLVPVSIGGWGVREVGMVGFLALVGVEKEAALMISVQLGMLLIIMSLPGAWLYLKRSQS